jgi:hypothetical protein
METPLTLLELARRARKIHTQRKAVVDGDLRLIYGAFFERTSAARSSRTSKCRRSFTFPPSSKTATGKIQKFVLRAGRSGISRQ